jgi:hypothetical protein
LNNRRPSLHAASLLIASLRPAWFNRVNRAWMRDTTSRLRTRLHAAPPRIYRHEPARASSRLQWRLSLWIAWECPTIAIVMRQSCEPSWQHSLAHRKGSGCRVYSMLRCDNATMDSRRAHCNNSHSTGAIRPTVSVKEAANKRRRLEVMSQSRRGVSLCLELSAGILANSPSRYPQ